MLNFNEYVLINKDLPENFNELRKIGENESYICQLKMMIINLKILMTTQSTSFRINTIYNHIFQ